MGYKFKEFSIIIGKEKPQDLSWTEYLLLLSLEIWSIEVVKDNKAELIFLDDKDYIRLLDTEIIFTDKYRKLVENDSLKITEIIKKFSELMCLKKGLSITSSSNRSIIKARLTEGYSPEDLLNVMEYMFKEWTNDYKMKKYLRLETLFNASKFQSYYTNWQSSLVQSDIERM